jgi:ComF family protein
MLSLVRHVVCQTLDLIVPRPCPACRVEVGVRRPFCPGCSGAVVRNHHQFLQDELPIMAPYRHRGPVARAIHRFKYEDCPHLAVDLASGWVREMKQCFPCSRGDVLVPVPLHPSRLAERGYNQSAIFAKELARRLELRTSSCGLCRIRATATQVGSGRQDRILNMKDAFQATPSMCDSRVWLVDDVVTTGATATSCIQALKEVGAQVLGVVAIARAERDPPR